VGVLVIFLYGREKEEGLEGSQRDTSFFWNIAKKVGSTELLGPKGFYFWELF